MLHLRSSWLFLLACAACGSGHEGAATPAAVSGGAPSGAAGLSTGSPVTPAVMGGSTATPTVAAVSGRSGTPASAGAMASAGRAASAGSSASDMDAGPASEPDAAVAAPRSTGPGDWTAGDYPKDLQSSSWLELTGLPGQAGAARQYKVHVPPSYDPKRPMPLVFCIHGLGQDGLLFCVSGANMPAKADAAGFILVMPNGYQNSWNAGTCCGAAVTERIDDVGFIRALFAELGKHLNIDLTRVYATGLSNGGYLSYRLACEASDLFVAVAPGAGAIGMNDIGGGTSANGDFAACKPANEVSVLSLHGTADPLIPYSLVKPSLDRIAMQNGCMLGTKPAARPASAGDTSCVSYEGCPPGVEVTGCTVQDGGHVWFGSPNCGTGVDAACSIVGANSKTLVNTDVVWSFFSAHARP